MTPAMEEELAQRIDTLPTVDAKPIWAQLADAMHIPYSLVLNQD